MPHFQNLRKNFLQHPSPIPYLQEFKTVRHKTWWTNVIWKKLYMLIKREWME